MKPSFLSLAAFILVFSFLCSSFASAQDEQPGQLPQAATFLPTHGVQYAPDHVLVRFRPGTAKQVAESAHMTVGAQVLRIYSVVEGLELVRLAPGVPVDEGVRLYRQFPDVLYAEPDYLRSATLTPNDPQYSSLWGMSNIRAPQAWDLSTGSNSVVVGDIDTGTDYNHPDLAANIYSNTTECNGAPNTDNDGNGYKNDCHGINAITGSGDPMDDNGHGTHTAGSVGAVGNNNVGVVGVNWNVKILPCKFLAANGSGYDSDAIECLQYYGWMHDHGVNLVAINASWGGAGYNQALSDAIYSQMVRGILFFAAAGNAGSNNDLLTFYPASYYLPNLVSVAAIDSGNNLAGFSDYGQTSVHLGAPGVGIRSTTPSNNYATWDGTSMATPYVTGVAALLMAQNSQRDWKAVRNLILAGGTATSSLTSKTITGKRLDAYGAMTCSNQALTARVQPRTNPATSVVTVVMGRPVLLAALHINCAAPSGNVTVTVNPGGNLVYLHDDGTDGDLASGDGIYTAQWTPDSLGTYTLAFPGGDNVTLQVLTTYQVGPTSYSWTEIAGSNPIPLDGEDVTTVCPSFFVKFGEGSFNCFRVSSVGGITFDDSLLAYPAPLPTTLTHSLVAPFWDFLEPTKTDASRMLFWQTSGVAPHRKAIIEWYQVPHSNYPAVVPSENITFEVVLFEDKSDVLIEYKDVIFGGSTAAYDSGRWASTGVQTGVSDAEQWGYQTTNLSNNFALGFVRNAPSPSATSLSPSTLPQGSSAFQLTVTGRNFVTNSVVRWNGNNRTTYYDNPRQLRADISAADVASFGTANVTVYTPILGGGTSGVLTFTISPFSNPVPVITSIDPQSVPGNTAPLTVTVHGSNFVPGSVVWNTNGSPQTTHYVNSTTLTVDVETQFHVLASSWLMQVVNPAPGGGNSNAVEFDVTSNVVPTNLSLTPQVVRAGGSGFTLNIYGEYFAAGAVVLWNGVPHAYNMVNIVSLNVPVSAAEIASGGNVAVTVTNPPPTGGTSAATFLPVWDFSIVAPKGFFVVPGATTDIGFKLHPVAGQQWVDVSCAAYATIVGPTCSIVGGGNQISLANGDVSLQVRVTYPVSGPSCNLTSCTINLHAVDHEAATLAHDVTMRIYAPTVRASDLNGDHKADILWRNTSTGDIALWLMSGPAVLSSGTIYAGTLPEWQIIGVGDFDGDSKADLLWRDTVTGDIAIWLMNGRTILSSGTIYNGALPEWQVVGTGDLNGDGKADILWRHLTSGDFAVWLMNGRTILSSGTISSGVPPDQQLVEVGDFDGNGKADLLWRDMNTGDISLWLMNGRTILSTGTIYSGALHDWQIAGVGDFNGDGKADLLWRHVNGDIAIWLMNGRTILSAGTIYSGALPDWQIVGVADFNGDGKADLLWRHRATGDIALWQMNGTAILSSGTIYSGSTAAWQIISKH